MDDFKKIEAYILTKRIEAIAETDKAKEKLDFDGVIAATAKLEKWSNDLNRLRDLLEAANNHFRRLGYVKKVFSIDKFIERCRKDDHNELAIAQCLVWAKKCDGLTEKEIQDKYGYAITPWWMIEVDK